MSAGHVVDGDSFPFDSQTFPSLTASGAYSASHVYSHEEIAELVTYAEARGVRVMPEVRCDCHTAVALVACGSELCHSPRLHGGSV